MHSVTSINYKPVQLTFGKICNINKVKIFMQLRKYQLILFKNPNLYIQIIIYVLLL